MNGNHDNELRDVLNTIEQEETIDKSVISVGKMTTRLIVDWLLWGLLLGIIYTFVFSLLTKAIHSLIIQAILAIILQGITSLIVWKLATSSAFGNNKTIRPSDISKVMKNLIIFTVIICVLNSVFNVLETDSKIDKEINSNIKLKFSESFINSLYNDEQKAEYNKQKEDAISKVKSQLYTYVIIVDIGLTIAYLAVLPFEKKAIEKSVQLSIS